MTNKLQPLGKRVAIKPQEVQEKTPGGLVIPPSATDERKPAYGEVIKLGIGKDSKGNALKFNVKVGDKVFFKKYSPEEIELDNETYLIVDTQDLIAVVK
jgi:chaperonin GroES